MIFDHFPVRSSFRRLKRKAVYGERKTVAYGLAGCTELKTKNQLTELLLEDDLKAAIKIAIDVRPRLFEPNDRVNVEGFSTPHSLACIRPRGETGCYWYPSNYFK